MDRGAATLNGPDPFQKFMTRTRSAMDPLGWRGDPAHGGGLPRDRPGLGPWRLVPVGQRVADSARGRVGQGHACPGDVSRDARGRAGAPLACIYFVRRCACAAWMRVFTMLRSALRGCVFRPWHGWRLYVHVSHPRGCRRCARPRARQAPAPPPRTTCRNAHGRGEGGRMIRCRLTHDGAWVRQHGPDDPVPPVACSLRWCTHRNTAARAG
jgi:hypothetical protein